MHTVRFFNQLHYRNYEEALDSGAVYGAPSLSLNTPKEVSDAIALIDAMGKCAGINGDITAVVEVNSNEPPIPLTQFKTFVASQGCSSAHVERTYKVWNPSKIALYGGDGSTYEQLLKIEQAQLCSWSSQVRTSDIKAFITAVQNETDSHLEFRELGERAAFDEAGNALAVGDRVICKDSSLQGDSDTQFDLVEGQKYTIDLIHDEDGLLSPMISLRGSNSGPVFSNRFKKLLSA